ncbi:MAG: tetratricopeptide repeat protein, partial [Bacteroidia bacterium]|nr:tetratricopeptide repeat protein [Bacteroidia bacterium]
MRIRYFLIIFSLFVIGITGYAQMSKANKYFEQNRYFKAIPYYKKATKKETSKKEAYLKLAECYKNVNEYESSEEAYKNALLSNPNQEPQFHYNYANILKANGKYTEALEQYNAYLKLKPNDENVKKAQKFCAEIKYWMSKPIEYNVKLVENINTENSEFSPSYNNGKLIYTAERSSFDFVEFSKSDYNGQPFLNVYTANVNEVKTTKLKPLSKKVNSENHDGPATVSSDGTSLYFTRVNISGKSTTAKIYYATGKDRNWKKVKPFEYNSNDYSVAHPCLSPDNTQLFFTSDMPGGFGGKDIWVCKRNGDKWEKPVNLGPDINTSGNEMFPCVKQNGILYFSSNGLPGFGGLDIYSAKQIEGKWILQRNEGLNLNSSHDDFGITFVNDTLGYFSSNRTGGKGKDDIYFFDFTDKSLVISGTVLLTENFNNPAVGIDVVLKEENGTTVGTTMTNNKGFFEFRNLDADKKYMAIIDNSDPQFSGKARYFLADGNKVIQRVTNKNGSDKFVFRNLPVDPNGLPDLYTNDDLTLAGNLLYGENPSKPLKNTKIKITNEFGDVIEEASTNEFGAFTFRNIPSDQNYLISMEDSDLSLPENTKITLTNKSGKEIKTFYTGKGKFNFKILASDKNTLSEMDAGDDNLVMDLFGYVYDENKMPIANAKIKMREDAENTMFSEINTSAAGKFNFRNLRADKNYIFEADDNDPVLKNIKKIYIADNKGRIYKIISKNGEGKFTFKIIESDKALMGEFVVDDPWLAVLEMKNKKEKEELTIVENIYYGSGDHKFDAAGQKVLDKVITVLQSNSKLIIELSSHTDSRSSDQFNLALSKKRAQFAVDYMVAKG